MGAAYSSLGRTKSFVCNFLSTSRCKGQVPAEETKCLIALEEIYETC